jgi:methylglyoxal synthase
MRLKGADPLLGVEMTSTGEVACLDYDFSSAYLKALKASNLTIPKPDTPVLITVKDEDHQQAGEMARKLRKMGFELFATRGTAAAIQVAGISDVKVLRKISEEGAEDSIVEYLVNRRIGFVIHSPTFGDEKSFRDGYAIRRMAVEFLIPVVTNIESARTMVDSLEKNGYDSILQVLLLNDLLKHAPLSKYI